MGQAHDEGGQGRQGRFVMLALTEVREREEAARNAHRVSDWAALDAMNLDVALEVAGITGHDCSFRLGGELAFVRRVELVLEAARIHSLRVIYADGDGGEYVGEYEVQSIDPFKLTALPLAPPKEGS